MSPSLLLATYVYHTTVFLIIIFLFFLFFSFSCSLTKSTSKPLVVVMSSQHLGIAPLKRFVFFFLVLFGCLRVSLGELSSPEPLVSRAVEAGADLFLPLGIPWHPSPSRLSQTCSVSILRGFTNRKIVFKSQY